jgi:hypothetical protein
MWRILAHVKNGLPPNPDRWSFPSPGAPSLRTDFPAFVPLARHCEFSGSLVKRLSQGVFEHLNRSYSLGRDHPDWRLGPIEVDRLWTITLHYHKWAYDLMRIAAVGHSRSISPTGEEPNPLAVPACNGRVRRGDPKGYDEEGAVPPFHKGGPGGIGGLAADLFRDYIDDWITNCGLEKPGARALAWYPYTIATRIGWWARSCTCPLNSFYLEGREELSAPGWGTFLDTDFRKRFLRSLWQQAGYLRHHLERDLRANHLLRNAVGLAWAGRFFDEPEAQEWLRTAEQTALEQAKEQVLPDGGHFERSPMYHIHVMGDFLVLGHLLEMPVARNAMREAWERMAGCLAWMRHPDGQIPLLNDSALNSACTPGEMLDLAQTIDCQIRADSRQGGKLFPDFGIFAWHGDPWTVFFDVGPVGVQYQLGHAHADTLTVEASYSGRRFLVDPGTCAYDLDGRRHYDRSTAAHNTVCVDGQNSSEVWHIFRCGRTSAVRNIHVETHGSGFRAIAEHTGYRYLPGKPTVQREIVQDPRCLIITDRCAGKGVHRLTGGWLLDPQWTAQDTARGWHVSTTEGRAVRVSIEGPPGLSLNTSFRPYHPEFGLECMTTRLEWAVEGVLPEAVTTIFALE